MKVNREKFFKTLLAEGRKPLNGWCAIPSMVTAEIIARSGFDSVTVDMEHGLIGYETGLSMLQAFEGGPATTLCRIPWLEPGVIMKMLDSGVSGIICPMINNRAEAERFVGACRYAPRGYRSHGPTRAVQIFGDDYRLVADDLVATIAMIESREGVENLPDILAVEELDAIYIGPGDLSISYGFPPQLLPEEKEVVDAIDYIVETTRKHGKYVGIHSESAERAKDVLAAGYDFTTVSTDLRIYSRALRTQIAGVRG